MLIMNYYQIVCGNGVWSFSHSGANSFRRGRHFGLAPAINQRQRQGFPVSCTWTIARQDGDALEAFHRCYLLGWPSRNLKTPFYRQVIQPVARWTSGEGNYPRGVAIGNLNSPKWESFFFQDKMLISGGDISKHILARCGVTFKQVFINKGSRIPVTEIFPFTIEPNCSEAELNFDTCELLVTSIWMDIMVENITYYK